MLPKAELLFIEVVETRKNDPNQLNLLIGTYDLLIKNAALRGDLQKQQKYQQELQTFIPTDKK